MRYRGLGFLFLMGISTIFFSVGCAATPPTTNTLPPDASRVFAQLGTIGVAVKEAGADRSEPNAGDPRDQGTPNGIP